jgi:hypothetical protein
LQELAALADDKPADVKPADVKPSDRFFFGLTG